MAHPYVQDLETQPHLEPISYENTTLHPLHIDNDTTRPTTPTTQWKVQEKTSKWRGASKGGMIRIEELAYKGPGIIEPHKDGPIAQPAWKRCCNKFNFISFQIVATA
jgi:hypothetical protein